METPCVIHPEAYSHRHCDYPLNRSIQGIGYGSLEQGLKAIVANLQGKIII